MSSPKVTSYDRTFLTILNLKDWALPITMSTPFHFNLEFTIQATAWHDSMYFFTWCSRQGLCSKQMVHSNRWIQESWIGSYLQEVGSIKGGHGMTKNLGQPDWGTITRAVHRQYLGCTEWVVRVESRSDWGHGTYTEPLAIVSLPR